MVRREKEEMEGKYSYEKDLWDGINIVNNRCEEAKNTLGDMIKLLDSRATLESDYSKKLQQLCSKPSGTPEGRTLGKAWQAYRQNAEQTQKTHSTIGQLLLKDVVNELNAYRKEYVKTRDQLMANQNQLQKELEKCKGLLLKAKQNYYQKSEVSEAAASAYSKAQQDPQVTAKNLTKYNLTCQKAKKEAELADGAYREQVTEFQSFQHKYEENMKAILSDFQKMEEKRLAMATELFEKIVKGQEVVVGELKADHVALQTAIQSIDGLNDLQNWISENKTGQVPPKPIEYEPFKSSLPPSSSPSSPRNSFVPTPTSSSSSSSIPSPTPSSTPSPPIISSATSSSSSSSNPPRGGVGLPSMGSLGNIRGGGGGGGGRGGAAAGGRNVPAPPSRSTVIKARGEYDYEAQDDSELSFGVGDVIVVTKQDNSGWWEGTLNGRSGMFPGSYVSLLDPNSPPPKKCKVIYEFIGESSDELTIKVGEVITILETAEGWYSGKNNAGEVGIFPANYVQLL